jgi:DNA-binding NarL/FixJ family response regulator
MDAGTVPVVIQIQLVISYEEPPLQLLNQGNIPLLASSLVTDFIRRLQGECKNQLGKIPFSGVTEQSRSPFLINNLTSREREIIELLRKGRSHKQIAAELNIASRTVSKHVENIYEKMGVNRKYEIFLKMDQQTQL